MNETNKVPEFSGDSGALHSLSGGEGAADGSAKPNGKSRRSDTAADRRRRREEAGREYSIHVWRVGDEFGYVIAKDIYTYTNAPILRKVSRSPTPWLTCVRTLGQLGQALKARAARMSPAPGARFPYALYRSKADYAPLCFPSLMGWLFYLDALQADARRIKQRPNFCEECKSSYQAKMIREDRCCNPHLDLGE